MRLTVADIVARLGGECVGNAGIFIDRVATLEAATPTSVAFLANLRYRAQLASTRAGCVIVAPALRDEAATRELIVRENRKYSRRQLIWFRKEPNLQWIHAAGEREETQQAVAGTITRLRAARSGEAGSVP